MAAENRFVAGDEDAGKRLDQFLTAKIADISRARVQQLIAQGLVQIDGKPQRATLRVRAGDVVEVTGEIKAPPLRAIAEDIPLRVVYEDDSLAVIDKPAGMMVHAGAGARDRGTLVNALLHHFKNLSAVGGELRPGIVHRLDKETSGLIIVAKADAVHRKLAEQFAARKVKKKYIALVHGWPKQASGSVSTPISRDRVRRTRMTTRSSRGREALSHYKVVRKMDSALGKFALLEVRIDTGRTHQIRVHLGSLGHPVVGDTLYGAPRVLRYDAPRLLHAPSKDRKQPAEPTLARNFLHAAELQFEHPTSGKTIALKADLPEELERFLKHIESAGAVR